MASGLKSVTVEGSVIRRWSWWVYCLLLMASLVPVAIVFKLVHRDVRAFTESGERNSIGIMETMPPTQWELPRQTAGKQGDSPPDMTGSDDNGSQYFDDADRRNAASALARNGDISSALALLNADKDGRNLSSSAAQAGITTLRQSMSPLWDSQMRDLNAYWSGLSDEQRRLLYQRGRVEMASTLTTILKSDDAERLQIIRSLPDSIWFTMLSNIHAGLAKDSPLPVTVIKLFLDPIIREERYPNRLYWKLDSFPTYPLADHAKAYSNALNQHVLWAILKDRAETDQLALKHADKQWAAWYESIWGVTFCKEFLQLDLKNHSASQLFPWKALIPQTRNLWADRLVREFKAQSRTDLAPSVIAANPWLCDSTQPVDSSFILRHVRSYPDWQNALSVFDYDGAESAAFKAIRTLQAGRFFVRTTQSGKAITLETLTADLHNERNAFISSKFPWLELIAELGGVNEGVPNPIRKKRGWKSNPKTSGVLWKDVKPAAVLGALKLLRQKNPVKKRIFDRLITVYAANRNMDVKRD